MAICLFPGSVRFDIIIMLGVFSRRIFSHCKWCEAAAFFLHRFSGAHELRQRFALSGRGFCRLRTAGTLRLPDAGAKRKGHLRFPFLFELLPFPCFLARRNFHRRDRSEKENDCTVSSAQARASRDHDFSAALKPFYYCYADGLPSAGATYLCRAARFPVCSDCFPEKIQFVQISYVYIILTLHSLISTLNANY